MSNQKSNTDSIPLKNYLKEEIPIEDIRDYASPHRINSIDFVKGFAIIFIILAHSSGVWFDKDWVFIHGAVYAVLDILGPSLFIFLSALSVIFSIKRKQGKLPEKIIRNRIYSRGVTIMAIGLLYNVIAVGTTVHGYTFPATLWGWNILMFIGFSQIASFYALKMKRSTRFITGFIIIFISEPLRQFIFLQKDLNPIIGIFHYIITSPAPQVTLFPWLAICFISTIFGEYLYEAMTKGEAAYDWLFRVFLFSGLLFIFFGIFFPFYYNFPFNFYPGWALQTFENTSFPGMVVPEYLQFGLFEVMNQQNFAQFLGMPLFLIRGTAASMFYDLGWALVIIAIFFYLIDIKKKYNYFVSMVQYYGKTSLSLFLIHYFFLTLYLRAFNIVFYPFIYLAFIGFLGFLMYYWMESGGVGSPEWIMIQIGRVGQKTGETMKKDAKIAYEKTKDGLKKLEDGIKKESKKLVEKTKDTIRKRKKGEEEIISENEV